LDPIYCYFEADERSYLKYMRLAKERKDSAREGRNPVHLALADEKGFPHRGSIDFIDNRLDTKTGTMSGRAVFSNADLSLTPGLFGRVRLEGSAPYEALLVPEEAVGSDQSQRFVFIVNGSNTVEYRAVQVGPLIHGFRVVREGLRSDDWFIVNGIQRAKTGMMVAPERREIAIANLDFRSPVSSAAADQAKVN
jgi:RND family efflux transporter MFP subunit